MNNNEKILNKLAFFGVSPENVSMIRINLFTQIHEICFHGKGGYDWNTVYNMPRWLRQFTFNKIQEFHKSENEAHENASNGNKNILMDPSGKINKNNYKSLSKSPPTSKPKVKYS